MNLSVSGHHYHITDNTKEHITLGVERLERFFSPIINVLVTVTQDGDEYRTDVVVNVKDHTLKSSDQGDKVFPVIDLALEKMERQLKKLHDKIHRF